MNEGWMNKQINENISFVGSAFPQLCVMLSELQISQIYSLVYNTETLSHAKDIITTGIKNNNKQIIIAKEKPSFNILVILLPPHS